MSKNQANEIALNNRTIAVWGLPGMGKSTFAAQIALLLAEQIDAKVLLADFDILFPTLDHYLGILKEPENVSFIIDDDKSHNQRSSLDYAYNAIERGIFNQKALGDIVISHSKQKNLDILTGNYSYEMFEMLTEKHFNTIINVAKKAYDYIIFDTNSVLFIDATFAALKNANVVYAVCEGDYTALREINKGIEYLRPYIEKEKFQVIINKYTKKHLDKTTIEQVLGETRLAKVIDYSEKCIVSKIEKKPFIMNCSKKEKKTYLDIVEKILAGE